MLNKWQRLGGGGGLPGSEEVFRKCFGHQGMLSKETKGANPLPLLGLSGSEASSKQLCSAMQSPPAPKA